jgi:1,4-alpha-glucan branching enzyme
MLPKSARAILDRFLVGHGHDAWQVLGAHEATERSENGWRFVLWAPHALDVAIIGDFSSWSRIPMARGPDRMSVFWHVFLPQAQAGQRYKFQVTGVDNRVTDRADPFASFAELRPHTASILCRAAEHAWRDRAWLENREHQDARHMPIAIYEMHVGSWRRHPDGRQYTWSELAEPLIEHLKSLEFTHVQLMPIYEHPYDPSWGYQVTGYFAPTSRWGTPDELRAFVDRLHEAGIGVLLDWVPAHFPKDGHALGRFDGTSLYEHPDPRRGEHPDWGTLVFDFARPEVASFLLASAHYWLESFHIDGFRVDAVASMLYLNYSRPEGTWLPNIHGGNCNLEALEFLKRFNHLVHTTHPGAITVAEESTAFPHVTGAILSGGIGFDFKWNMGWMHDTLAYLATDPLFRAHHHDSICFAASYAFSEAFMLPLSHDEVVHLKGSLWRKMAVRKELKIAQLRQLYGYQWLHPGKKLLFMGGELAQETEWNADGELPWALASDRSRRDLHAWLRALNQLYRAHPALHAGDCQSDGFAWVEGSDASASVLVTERSGGGKSVVVVVHFTPVWRKDYWLPLPAEGEWHWRLHSELKVYGGTLDAMPAPLTATQDRLPRPIAHVDLPPFGVLVLEQER